MVTAEMRRVANDIARKHKTALHGVLMLLSADGPAPWSGCIPVTEYRPEYKPGAWRPAAEYRRKSTRKRRARDIFEEYADLSDFDY